MVFIEQQHILKKVFLIKNVFTKWSFYTKWMFHKNLIKKFMFYLWYNILLPNPSYAICRQPNLKSYFNQRPK